MRSALSEGLAGAEQAHSTPPRNQIAVDIPPQSPARHPVLGSSGENLDGLYVGSLSSQSFGTSPGHGLGYLMRSRRRAPTRQVRYLRSFVLIMPFCPFQVHERFDGNTVAVFKLACSLHSDLSGVYTPFALTR